MFDPVPNYRKIHDEETAKVELKAFQERVREHAAHRSIKLENRFDNILSVCDRLKRLIAKEGIDIWKRPAREPIESFQILFQLLVYLLGDRGLLFDEYGAWREEPNIDDWETSEDGYLELVWGMRNRNCANMQLNQLRKDLKSRSGNMDNYKTSFDDTGTGKEGTVKELTEKDVEADVKLMELHRKYLQRIKYSELEEALSILSADPLCRQAAPLFLFSRSCASDKKNYASAFYASLKKYNNKLPKPTTPDEIAKCSEDWDFYSRCDKFFKEYANCKEFQREPAKDLLDAILRRVHTGVNLFEPYSLTADICKQVQMEISDDETIYVAHYGLSLFNGEKVEPSEAIANIKVGEIPITEIIRAFSIIWRAPGTKFEVDNDANRPIIKKELKLSLRTLYEAGILGGAKNGSQGSYTDSMYDALLKEANGLYGIERYSFSEEAYWLVTGYMPPYNYIPKKNQKDLYACCFYDLHRIWHQYHCILKDLSPRYVSDYVSVGNYLEASECAVYGNQIGIGGTLHRDILKARCRLADKWDDDLEKTFLGNITSLFFQSEFAPEQMEPRVVYRKLLKIARTIYDTIKDKKTTYKGFQYAAHLIYFRLLDECFALTEFHLYQEVFETIALVSRALWPIE